MVIKIIQERVIKFDGDGKPIALNKEDLLISEVLKVYNDKGKLIGNVIGGKNICTSVGDMKIEIYLNDKLLGVKDG